jgi:hypothetical protein
MGDDWNKAFADALSHWAVYLWSVLLAAWGGAVSYRRRLLQGRVVFSLSELVGECATSAFTGLVTAYLCRAASLEFYYASVLIAMSGYMGGTALAFIGAALESRFKALAEVIFGPGIFKDRG